jgi:hypothetical protein
MSTRMVQGSILFLLACPAADPGRELNGDGFGTAPTEGDADTDSDTDTDTDTADSTPSGGDSDTPTGLGAVPSGELLIDEDSGALERLYPDGTLDSFSAGADW